MSIQSIIRRLVPYAAAALGLLLLISVAGRPQLARAAHPDDPVAAAWEKARAAGAYHFAGDVTQTTIPSPTIANVGRTSRVQMLHLRGRTDLRRQTVEMQLWANGGSVLSDEGSLGLKVENGKSFVRSQGPAGWGDWQEADGAFDGFAPDGDFLAYLAAVRDIQAHAPETHTIAGRTVTFTRYSFTLDGPAYAASMRDSMEEALRARGPERVVVAPEPVVTPVVTPAPRRQDHPRDDMIVEHLEEKVNELKGSRDSYKERLTAAEKLARDADRKLKSELGKADAVLRDLQHNLSAERKAYRILQLQFEALVDKTRGLDQLVESRVADLVSAQQSGAAPAAPAAEAAPVATVLPDAPPVVGDGGDA